MSQPQYLQGPLVMAACAFCCVNIVNVPSNDHAQQNTRSLPDGEPPVSHLHFFSWLYLITVRHSRMTNDWLLNSTRTTNAPQTDLAGSFTHTFKAHTWSVLQASSLAGGTSRLYIAEVRKLELETRPVRRKTRGLEWPRAGVEIRQQTPQLTLTFHQEWSRAALF